MRWHFVPTPFLRDDVPTYLHCNNCSGQNKKSLHAYFAARRAMTRKHISVTINFMPPEHTEFAQNWCFGLLKRTFRRTEVHCLDDLCEVVRQSTPVKKVMWCPVVVRPAGLLPWILQGSPGMEKSGHFSIERPVAVLCKETLADEEAAFQIVGNVQAVVN